jgi:hypothetical protein
MKTYQLKFLGPQVQSELETLARLTKSPIQKCEVITITFNNDELDPIVKRILGDLVIDTQYSAPRPKEAIGGTELDVRTCEHCLGEYHPVRKDQKYCTRPDCKKARQTE